MDGKATVKKRSIYTKLVESLFTAGATATIVLMILLVTVDVFLRFAGGFSLLWILDAVGIILLCFFFVIMPWSCETDTHVRMNIFYNMFGTCSKSISNIVGNFGALAFFGTIGWAAFSNVSYMIAVQVGTGTVSLPLWPAAVFVGITCAITVLVVLKNLISSVANLVRSRADG